VKVKAFAVAVAAPPPHLPASVHGTTPVDDGKAEKAEKEAGGVPATTTASQETSTATPTPVVVVAMTPSPYSSHRVEPRAKFMTVSCDNSDPRVLLSCSFFFFFFFFFFYFFFSVIILILIILILTVSFTGPQQSPKHSRRQGSK
jgi:hypothetical protein